MAKKGFLRKTGCILISTSIILTGFTFFGSTISEAEYSDGYYTDTTGNATISDGELDEHQSELVGVTGIGSITVDDYGLDGFDHLQYVNCEGKLTVGEYAFQGDSSLESIVCGSMSGATGMAFNGCQNVSFSIGSSGGGCYTDEYGALYNGTTLVFVPRSFKNGGSTEYYVKAGTTKIDEGAFSHSNVTDLYFEGGDGGDSITDIGGQHGWPSNGLIVHAYNSSKRESGKVHNFFTYEDGNDARGNVYVWFEPGGVPDPDKVSVEVIEKCGDTILKDETAEYEVDAEISASAHEGYKFIGDNSPYKVTSDASQTVTFEYEATTPTPTTVSVQVVEKCGDTILKDETAEYTEGAVITASAHDGYEVSGTSSYIVTSDATQKVEFEYTKTEPGPSPGPGPDPGPSPSPSPSPSGGGGGGSSSGGETPATPTPSITTPGNVSSDAQTTNKYVITEGANQSVAQDAGPIRIVCNGPVDKFAYLLIDGIAVDRANYSIQSGSTILTLTKEYVASLPASDHAVQFQYTDGYAFTGLTITAAGSGASASASTSAGRTTTTVTYKVSSDGSISSGHTQDNTPKTADGFDNRYLLCLAIFLLGAGAILFSRQKKFEAILASQRDEY